jgi:hypothetical protein
MKIITTAALAVNMLVGCGLATTDKQYARDHEVKLYCSNSLTSSRSTGTISMDAGKTNLLKCEVREKKASNDDRSGNSE